MNTEFDRQPGQRKPYVLMSGVAVALCLFVVALMERRRLAASAEAAKRARSFRPPAVPDPLPARDAFADPSNAWTPAGPAGDPVWESDDVTATAAAPADEGRVDGGTPFDLEHHEDDRPAQTEAHLEPEGFTGPTPEHSSEVEVDGWQAAPVSDGWPEASEPESAPAIWQPAPASPPAPHVWEAGPGAAGWHSANETDPAPTASEEAGEAPRWAEDEPAVEANVEHPAAPSTHGTPEPAAPAANVWFGSSTPAAPWQQPSDDPVVEDAEVEAGADPAPETSASESVVELPAAAEQGPPQEDPKKLPPPRFRRFMGTGATVLAIGLVLGAGFLVSGATADSTSDPATVPDAVGTTAPAAALADTSAADTTVADTTSTADTTTTDTTTTDTTTTDTTTTGTTTTDTTTTDTTTTDTTPTDTTSTDTTSTDTTSTSTTPVDPPPTTTAPEPPPVDPAPVNPPASDPATVPATPAAPDASVPADPGTTDVGTPPATPAAPTTPVAPAKPKVEAPKAPSHTHTSTPPARAHKGATPKVGAPAPPDQRVVTLASGADPIGSLLSANSVIPAVDAALLPTPAQVSFYVKASKPLPPLPTLVRIEHPVAQRLVAAGRHGQVGWTVLAAVARLESNLGTRPGLLAGRKLPTTPSGDGLAALATFLHEHGAKKDPLAPATAKKALTVYFGGSTRKADRAIALAALYGALGPAGMQHGVRAETARLQRRVLRDRRVHLTIAGRSDIRHGRVDPRVLVTLEYLANSFHKLGVSDLVSGGALFSRSGSVSAHLYGRAADVASLHGKAVKGHQGPGTMTEQAIRKLLLLPKSLRPRQVISLMDVDGPTGNHGSFALPDHYDRIQIDY